MFQVRLWYSKAVCVVPFVLIIAAIWSETGFCADASVNTIRYDFPENDDPGVIGLAVGYFDFAKHDDPALDLRLELRPALNIGVMRPWAAVETTSDGSVYGAGGLLVDIYLGDHWVLTPSAGAGAYSRGSGKDMGSVLLFRVQGDIAYRFDNRSRLALSISHLSNARTSHQNPGTEIISLYYLIPLAWLF